MNFIYSMAYGKLIYPCTHVYTVYSGLLAYVWVYQ